MKELPITEVRDELTSFPEYLERTHETVAVTRRGKPVLAILPWQEYEALVETLEVLSDPQSMNDLKRGIQEAKQGKAISWEAAKRRLSL